MKSSIQQIWHYLIQPDAREDAGFRKQAAHISYIGLRFLTGAITLLMGAIVVAHVALDQGTDLLPYRAVLYSAIVGSVTFLISLTSWADRHAVLIGCICVLLITMGLVWSIVLSAAGNPASPSTYNGEVLLMLLVAVLTLSLHPLHTLWLGLSIVVNAWIAEYYAVSGGVLAAGQASSPAMNAVLLACVLFATALSAVSYRRIYSSFVAHRHELEAAETARDAQSQLLLSEGAASMGRFAASVSHEINTPLGALMSSVQLLQGLPKKRAAAPPEKSERLDQLEQQVLESIRQSSERLKDSVARMQRVTNLDRAEVLEVNINELLTDVVSLFRADQPQVHVVMQASDAPPTAGSPQQLSAVFSNLLHSAADRLGGRGEIQLETSTGGSEISVRIHDDGEPIPEETAKALFDLGFQREGSRMAGANWGLYSAREMVRRHGGDIQVESAADSGTTVLVTLRIRTVIDAMS